MNNLEKSELSEIPIFNSTMVSLKEEKIKPECTTKADSIFHAISLLFNPDHEPREPEVWNIIHQIFEI